MVRGDHQPTAALGDAFEDVEERAVLEPALGEAAVGGIVIGQLADHLHLGAGMAQHVHEVVDDHVERIAHEVVQAVGEFLARVQVEDLVVAELHVLA